MVDQSERELSREYSIGKGMSLLVRYAALGGSLHALMVSMSDLIAKRDIIRVIVRRF